MSLLKTAIVGTGNVGFHLARQLTKASAEPVAIVSREQTKSLGLIEELGLSAEAVGLRNLNKLDADVIILAVPDSSIEQVINDNEFPPQAVVVHTSGSQSIDLLSKIPKRGVLYPFQTFTKSKAVSFDKIPIFIEGSDDDTLQQIKNVGLLLNSDVRKVSSEARLKLHLAAVFACNFTNHMYALAENILANTGGKLSDLNHLMLETVDKAVELSARAAQTGPAIRGDQEVIEKHLKLLLQNPDAETVYQLITDQISKNKT